MNAGEMNAALPQRASRYALVRRWSSEMNEAGSCAPVQSQNHPEPSDDWRPTIWQLLELPGRRSGRCGQEPGRSRSRDLLENLRGISGLGAIRFGNRGQELHLVFRPQFEGLVTIRDKHCHNGPFGQTLFIDLDYPAEDFSSSEPSDAERFA